jgi:hypothetical protein
MTASKSFWVCPKCQARNEVRGLFYDNCAQCKELVSLDETVLTESGEMPITPIQDQVSVLPSSMVWECPQCHRLHPYDGSDMDVCWDCVLTIVLDPALEDTPNSRLANPRPIRVGETVVPYPKCGGDSCLIQ